MNSKTARLIRKWCKATKAPYKITKDEYNKTSRNKRFNLKQTMRETV